MGQETLPEASGTFTLAIDEMAAESRWHQEPADHLTAEKRCDRQWEVLLLDRVLTRLREQMTATGKGATFEALKFSPTGEKRAYAGAPPASE
jgi:hypothetical protein